MDKEQRAILKKAACLKWSSSADEIDVLYKKFDQYTLEYNLLSTKADIILAKLNKWWNVFSFWLYRDYSKNHSERDALIKLMQQVSSEASIKVREARLILEREWDEIEAR